MQREVEILKRLDHPNICKLFSTVNTDEAFFLIMEYVEGGDLFTYIMRSGPLSSTAARRLFIELVKVVQYCHSMKIIHRDIKHKNILLDAQLNPKLIDFGLSNYSKDEGEMRSTFCGTPAYAAPEMILAQRYHGPEVDVWSLGIVLYTMFSKRFPFRTVSDIIVGNFTDLPDVEHSLTDLLRKILVVNPQERTNLEEILQHPWVTQQP